MAKLNKTLSDAVQVPPDATSNSIVYMHALFCGGALSGYTQVKLGKPWSEDFGRLGWMHPEHNNEALVFSKDRDLWVILDCCGDTYYFNDLESALSEFNSPEGHQIWMEARAHGQHWEDRYFALK